MSRTLIIFDDLCYRHNNGHVSRSVVRRVLARLGVLPTAPQLRALEARYLDDCGFSYVRLLDEVTRFANITKDLSNQVGRRIRQMVGGSWRRAAAAG